jgi:multidrug efflux system outer membrane protein
VNKVVAGIIIFSSVSLGCMLGPKGNLATPSLSSDFLEKGQEITSKEMGSLAWWEQFKDPELSNLIMIAFDKNYDLQLARQKVHELRASYQMESAGLWPKVNAFGSYLRYKRPNNFLGVPSIASPYQNLYVLGFDATWEIDFFGKVRSAKKAAYFDVLSSEENIYNVQVSIAAEIGRIYTDIRAHQQRIYVLNKKIKAQEAILSLSDVLLFSGLDSEIQKENEKADLANNKSVRFVLEKELKNLYYQLAYLCAKNPEELESLIQKRGPIPFSEDKIAIGIPSDLLRRRPDIRIAEKNYFAACARIGQAKADLFPSVSLTGLLAGISSQTNNIFLKAAQSWLVWPSINWNIFQGWKTMANIKVQTSKQRQALISYEMSISAALRDVESALNAFTEEKMSLQQFKYQLIAKKRVYELKEKLLVTGLKQKKDFLISQKDFFDAQDAYLQSKQRSMANLISLYKALGGGWQEDSVTKG